MFELERPQTYALRVAKGKGRGLLSETSIKMSEIAALAASNISPHKSQVPIADQAVIEQTIHTGQAIALLRAGSLVVLSLEGRLCRVRPLDLMTDPNCAFWHDGVHRLALTSTRVRQIGIEPATQSATNADFAETVEVINLTSAMSRTTIRSFGDPMIAPFIAKRPGHQRLCTQAGDRLDRAGIELCKLAGLLPAAIMTPLTGKVPANANIIDVETVETYRTEQAATLEPLGEARVPLEITDDARIVPFRPQDGRMEHLAILIGEPEKAEAPLCRIHSECFTGDLLGSLRCDCGEQLKGAIAAMAADGHGVLLYLAQEGRGIGLANKLRAYQLQDRGLDTVEANQHLGFEPDERDFLSAATMLKKLGITKVRLMSNNPNKIEGLSGNGVEVLERVAHEFAANDHNRDYLRTKKVKSGHMLELQDQPSTGTDD